MIKRVFDAINQPLGRIGVLIAVLIIVSAGIWGIIQTQTTPPQPIACMWAWAYNACIAILARCGAPLRDFRPKPSAGDATSRYPSKAPNCPSLPTT